MEKLFAAVDALNEEYIKIWEDVCNIESPTKYKAGVDAVCKYFCDLARKRGWKVEEYTQETLGNYACITLNPDATGQAFSLSGHMDTVQEVGSCGTPAVRIEGGKIFGPGVVDCKGGIVAGLLAMDALDKCGFRARPVHMILQSDEETSSQGKGISLMLEKGKESVAFINLEGHTEGKVCLQRKGIRTFTFTVHGVEGHASQCAKIGANAIAEAASKILEIEKIKDHDGITCCTSLISGGTTANTIPGQCEFKVNVRFATAEQEKWICTRMQEIADMVTIPGCKTTLSHPAGRPAMELVDRNLVFFETLNTIWETCGLSRMEYNMRQGGSDAAQITAAGIPCIDNLGAAGGKIHTIYEYGELDSLAAMAKRMAAAIWNI